MCNHKVTLKFHKREIKVIFELHLKLCSCVKYKKNHVQHHLSLPNLPLMEMMLGVCVKYA
jgi:hypothetical protein